MTHAATAPTPTPGRSIWRWILGGIAVLLLAMAGCGWYAWKKVAGIMRDGVQSNPVVQEHIGTIQTMTLDTDAAAKAGTPGTMVFRVTGSKGEGQVRFTMDTTGGKGKATLRGSLTMKNGETYPLGIDSSAVTPAPPTSPAPPPPPAASPAPTRKP